MTPAIAAARRAGIPFQVLGYEHDPRAPSFGKEAAERLGLPAVAVFKTLVVELNDDPRHLAVGIVPVNLQLDPKALARACGAKKAALTDTNLAERVTGYLVGGISPIGQKRRLPTRLDRSAEVLKEMYVSAGRRGLELALAPADLLGLCGGSYADIAKR